MPRRDAVSNDRPRRRAIHRARRIRRATIALILTIPTGRAVASTGSDVVFPFLEAGLRMLADAFWSVLQYL